MSNKNRVSVTVTLLDNFSGTLKKLDEQLDKISRKVITPRLEIQGTGEINTTKAKLESLDEIIEVLLNVMGDKKLEKIRAQKESLSGVENIYIKTHDNELNKTIAKQKALRRQSAVREKERIGNDFLRNIRSANRRSKKIEGIGPKPPRDYDLGDTSVHGAAERTRRRQRRRAVSVREGNMPRINQPMLRRQNQQTSGVLGRVAGFFSGLLAGGAGGGGGGGGGGSSGGGGERGNPFASAGKSLIGATVPRGQFTQDLVAVFMPIMISLYTAIGGMIAAFGATAAAGLSIGLLGIIGFGENAADSLKLAEVRMRIFGRELFRVFKPVSKTFAPAMDSFFRQAPHALGRMTTPFQSLTAYIPALNRHGNGIIDWTSALIDRAVELQPKVTQLTSRFGQLLGIGIIDFFTWLVEELYNNQDALLRVMGVAKSFIHFLYRIFLLWSVLVGVLRPVADLLSVIADVLTNKVVVGITATVIAMIAMGAIMVKLLSVGALLATLGLGGTIAAMVGPLAAATGAMYAYAASIVGAAKAKALLLGLTGVGLVVALGAGAAAMNAVDSMAPNLDGHAGGSSAFGTSNGFGGSPSGGSSVPPAVTVINIENAGKDEINYLADHEFVGKYGDEQDYDSNTAVPQGVL